MKHNIIFAALTAAILILGFYAMDIARLFGFGKEPDKLISSSGTISKQVYLSTENPLIQPMKMIGKAAGHPSAELSDMASAIVLAIASYNEKMFPSWGIKDALNNSWRLDENGRLFLDGWEYICRTKQHCLVDCILDRDTLDIIYIRFYEKDAAQPTADEVNRGLERIDEAAKEIYPKLEDILHSHPDIFKLSEGNSSYYINGDIFARDTIIDAVKQSSVCMNIVNMALKNADIPDLGRFWLAPMIMSSALSCNNSENAGVIMPAVDALRGIGDGYSPEYSAYGSCIYQKMKTPDGEMTVMYNVFSGKAEGFYYDTKNGPQK